MLDHRPEFEKDVHYKKGDRIFFASDPEGHEALGIKRMQSLYGEWKKSGNVGKMKTDGKNAANIDAMLRHRSENPTTRKPREAKKTTGGGAAAAQYTAPLGKIVKAKTVGGEVFEVNQELVGELKRQGVFLMWSRNTGSPTQCFSFGTLKSVSVEILRYVSDLGIETVDTIGSFLSEIANKKMILVRPHECLGFLNAQLLMAAVENGDKDLESVCLNILDPVVGYLKARWERQDIINKARLEAARESKDVDSIEELPKIKVPEIPVMPAFLRDTSEPGEKPEQAPFAYEEVTVEAVPPRAATQEEEENEVDLLLGAEGEEE